MDTELSDYYMVDKIQRIYGLIMIAIPKEHCQVFGEMSWSEMIEHLKELR